MGMGIPAYILPNVRVRAMKGQMLSYEVWQNLDDARDIPAVIETLADTSYGPQLAGFEEACPPCELLEARLNADLALRFSHVIDLTPASDREVVVLLKQTYEVDNLKTLLRGIEMGEDPERIKTFLFPLGRAASLDYESLLEVKTVADLVVRVQGTPYGAPLEHALRQYEEEHRLFPLEVALDLDYYRRLWRAITRLEGESKKWARLLIGTWYDITNILWALRYRYYHNLTLAEIINYTLPYGYRSNDTIIRAIAEGEDVSTVLSRVWGSDAPEADLHTDAWLPKLEVKLHRYHARLAEGGLVGYPFHLGTILAYLILKRYEVQDLMVLAEAKMSRIPRAQYYDYMVHQFR